MNLIDQAESDLSFTLEDVENGFAVELEFDNGTDQEIFPVKCSDIGYLIDPQTGSAVFGRNIEVFVRIKTLESVNFGYPKKSWKVNYTDTNGKSLTLSILEVRPDRTLGLYGLVMEAYKT